MLVWKKDARFGQRAGEMGASTAGMERMAGIGRPTYRATSGPWGVPDKVNQIRGFCSPVYRIKADEQYWLRRPNTDRFRVSGR